MPQDVYALLAQANLLRIRGNWQEATENCMAAMRLVPGNVAAQSLLGDIYENQGCVDDAIQWYRMALDANPNSPADRQKLSRLLAMRGESIDDEPHAHLVKTAVPMTTAKIRAKNNGLIVLAVVIGIAVVATILTSVVQSRAQMRDPARPAGSSASIDTPPVLLGPPQIDDPTADNHGQFPRDPWEMSLTTSLRAAVGLDPNIQVSDVIVDPRSGRLTVTFVLQAADALDHEGVLREALRVAQSLARIQQANAYSYFTIRVDHVSSSLPMSGNGAPIIFIGDISRSDIANVPGDPSTIPSQQLQTAFGNQWWTQGL
jgi:hypothetical protein